MRRFSLYAFLLLFFIGTGFSQSGSSRQLASFSEVTTQEGIKVYLEKGDSESAKIEASGISVDEVLTDVNGDVLKIHLDGNNHRNVEVSVYVTFVELEALSSSSGSSIEVKSPVNAGNEFEVKASSAGSISVEVEASEVEAEASSSGSIKLTVYTGELEVEVSSAGDVMVEGEVDYLDVKASSSGDFQGYGLLAKTVEVSASSGASIKVNASRELEARASSGASIRYKGNPTRTDADSSSGGSVKRA